jgi:hypothetical protein
MRVFDTPLISFARTARGTAVCAVRSLVGYDAALPLLRSLARSALLQATVFASRSNHLQPVGRLAGTTVDLALARSRFLLRMLGERWRLLDLGREGSGRSLSWLELHEIERFEAAASCGPVVLVSSHFGAWRLGPVLLARRGRRLLTLEGSDTGYAGVDTRLTARIEIEVLRGDGAFPARSMLAARRHLRAGGVVMVAGDGLIGPADAQLPFCGGVRAFRSTFASMAVDTDATVIPIFAPVDETGRVHLQFLAPLDAGPSSISRQERIDTLVRSYASELEHRWLTDPGNLSRYQWDRQDGRDD